MLELGEAILTFSSSIWRLKFGKETSIHNCYNSPNSLKACGSYQKLIAKIEPWRTPLRKAVESVVKPMSVSLLFVKGVQFMCQLFMG